MKTILLFFALLLAGSVKAQALKEALFSGRLKSDTGATVKHGDSLKLLSDSLYKLRMDSLKKPGIVNNTQKPIVSDTTLANSANRSASDTKTWKQFIDEYSEIIKKEVLPSSKIKKGTYSILIEYNIETDGNITSSNIYCTPENPFLVQQIKTRMMMNAPKLSPVLMSNGKPRKALKKQVLTFVKEKE